MISKEGYILRSINRHGHFGENLHPASISTILKALQKDLYMDFAKQPFSGHSFRVGAALDLLDQGEPLEKIMLRGGLADGFDCHEIPKKLEQLVRKIHKPALSLFHRSSRGTEFAAEP